MRAVAGVIKLRTADFGVAAASGLSSDAFASSAFLCFSGSGDITSLLTRSASTSDASSGELTRGTSVRAARCIAIFPAAPWMAAGLKSLGDTDGAGGREGEEAFEVFRGVFSKGFVS